MRFGRDQPALLKPEDNGGLEQIEGGETQEGGDDVIYDVLPPETENLIKKKQNTTKT